MPKRYWPEFRAILTRQDLPTLDNVLALAAQRQRGTWWFAIVAGLDEKLAEDPSLDDISDDLLRAMLARRRTYGWPLLSYYRRPNFVMPSRHG